MILLTTSRRPTQLMRTFCRDLARSIPNVIRINRGKLSLDGIAEKALEFNADRVIIIDRWNGRPTKIELFCMGPAGLTPVPPLIYFASIRFQREFEAKIKSVKSLTITTSTENSPGAMKIAESLSSFLKIPLLSMENAASKHQVSMHVSSNTSRHLQITFMLFPKRVEVGPRITVSHVVWETPK